MSIIKQDYGELSGGEKEITSIDPLYTDITTTEYTVPADGILYIRVQNNSNNAPTVTLDSVTQPAPTSVLLNSYYHWIYAFYVKEGQAVKVTYGSGGGRASYTSLIRLS